MSTAYVAKSQLPPSTPPAPRDVEIAAQSTNSTADPNPPQIRRTVSSSYRDSSSLMIPRGAEKSPAHGPLASTRLRPGRSLAWFSPEWELLRCDSSAIPRWNSLDGSRRGKKTQERSRCANGTLLWRGEQPAGCDGAAIGSRALSTPGRFLAAWIFTGRGGRGSGGPVLG